MRSKIAIVGFLVIMLFVNGQIYRHEQQRNHGNRVILKLAPVDPRSLIQGDYMVLRYQLAERIEGDGGTVYLKPDDRGVATWASVEESPGSLPLQYRRMDGQVKFDIESFFFQEGTRSTYEQARYAEIKVDKAGHPTLLRLLDENLSPLGDRS